MSAIAGSVAAPSSPFSALLRRSRFASYDPFIKQAYSAPPEHACRGSYGLKRPIPLKRRDAFVSVSGQFDSPHQFVDWESAESQVRFVRRFEEMEVFPVTEMSQSWGRRLDHKTISGWAIDSEFCERHEGPEVEEMDEAEAQLYRPADSPGDTLFKDTLPTMGQAGKGQYGAHRPHDSPTGAVPNIHAMSNKEFERYLKKLRKLRPEFKEYLAKLIENADEESDLPRLRGKSLYELAQNAPVRRLHRFFLASHTAKQLKTKENTVIEPRPHVNGGLMYARLPHLYSHLYARKHPGIVLHSKALDASKRLDRSSPEYPGKPAQYYIVSLGGLSSVLHEADVSHVGHFPAKAPLFAYTAPSSTNMNPSPITAESFATTAEGTDIGHSVIPMRLKYATLDSSPAVVGHRREGLQGVRLTSHATAQTHEESIHASNPHQPGTYLYMVEEPPQTASAAAIPFQVQRQQSLLQQSPPKRSTTSLLDRLDDAQKTPSLGPDSSETITSLLKNLVADPSIGNV